MSELKRGSIIQANEKAKGLTGTVLIVEEIRVWGVLAFIHVPLSGDAYFRLRHDEFVPLGAEAVFLPQMEGE